MTNLGILVFEKAMEGKIYRASWEKTKGGFRIWLLDHKRIVATSRSFSVAEAAILEKICLDFGDGEALLDLDPPRPVPQQKASMFVPEFLELGSNTVAMPKSTVDISTEGFCKKCRSLLGVRSETPLAIAEIDTGSQIAFGPLPGKGMFTLLSEQFLEFLTPAERRQLQLRKVIAPQRCRNVFFEVTMSPQIPLVALKDARATMSNCAACKRKWWFYGGDLPFNFVCRAHLPTPLPELFVAGGEFEKVLCVSTARWRQMRTSALARGIVTSRIGVLPYERSLSEPNRVKPESKIIARLRTKGLI